MDTHSDTSILNCYRCMNEWETYSGREKLETRKCNLCHRTMCKTCMSNKEYKQKCLICELNPHKRECWICIWIPPYHLGIYKRLLYLHEHLNVFHYGKKYFGERRLIKKLDG